MMKLLVLVAFTSGLLAQKNPFEGRWDLDIKTAKDTFPDWMEVVVNWDSPAIRIQPRGGAVRPAEAAHMDGKTMSVTLSTANGNRPGVVWELTADGDNLTGTEKRGGVADEEIKGVRAPEC